MVPTADTLRAPALAPPAEAAPARLPRGLRLRITVAIPLTVMLLVALSGFLSLWLSHPLFLASRGATTGAEIEQHILLAMLAVVGFALVATLVALRLAASIARPLRQLTSRVESLRAPTSAEPSPPDGSEIAALGSALEGVVSSVSSLILDSYTLRSLEGAVVTVDQDGVATSCNAVAEQVLGARADDMVGNRLTCVVPQGPDNGAFLRSLDLALAGAGCASSAEATVRTRGGKVVQLGYTISPLHDELGHSLGLVVTFKDLAEHKLAEQLMRRTENLAVLGSIAAGLVHEIRTPLGVARSHAEMIEDELPPDSALRLNAQQIREAVDRMDALVRDLRTLGNPEPRCIESHDLSGLASRTVAFCRADELAKGIEVREDYAEGLPPVRGDGERLGQVLLNLLRNAFEAVDAGGHVAVATHVRDGHAGIAVHNTGSYIPPAERERLFEPFFTRKRRGTGLGLAIAHQVVRAHGGRIAVDSDPDTGTTFTVELPLVGPDAATEV